jgi:hypothetical protein
MTNAHLRVAAACALAVLLATSCSTAPSGPDPSKSIPKPTIPPSIASSTVVIDGKSVVVPVEEYSPNRPIKPLTDTGQQIIISSSGLLPRTLFAPSPVALTWTNLTTQPVTVTFAGSGISSGAITPGGSWTYRTDRQLSIGYGTTNGYHGQVSVGLLPVPPLPSTTTTTTSAAGDR